MLFDTAPWWEHCSELLTTEAQERVLKSERCSLEGRHAPPLPRFLPQRRLRPPRQTRRVPEVFPELLGTSRKQTPAFRTARQGHPFASTNTLIAGSPRSALAERPQRPVSIPPSPCGRLYIYADTHIKLDDAELSAGCGEKKSCGALSKGPLPGKICFIRDIGNISLLQAPSGRRHGACCYRRRVAAAVPALSWRTE